MPPQFVTFQVPLTFNKLDIRDYLLHAYGVDSVSVRSHVAQRPPRASAFTGRIGRPPPIKYMTVELEKPFVWPAEPDAEEESKWHSEAMQRRIAMEKDVEARRAAYLKKGEMRGPGQRARSDDRTMLAQQAEDILSGKAKWNNRRELDPRWQQKGEAEGAKEESK